MISVVILTKNEENNIKECLDSVKWCDEIIIIDDNSTDKTIKIAEQYGAKIFKHSLRGNFSRQRNFGLEKASGDWIFFVDADERITQGLKEEICFQLKEDDRTDRTNRTRVCGYYFKRVDFFMGRFLKFGEIGGVGGFGGIKILRLAKRDAGKLIRNVDEVWKIVGKTKTMKNPLLHYPHPNLIQFLESINERSTLNAQYLFENKKNLNIFEWSKPVLKFIQNYFLKFGFLDGISGFVFAILMSLHSYLVRGKLHLLWEKNRKGEGGKRGKEREKISKALFLLWVIFILGSYLYFLFQRGISRWSKLVF